MREPRLFVEQELESGQQLRLPGTASHYLAKVLRRRRGQHVQLFNGCGGCYRAEVLASSKGQVEVRIGDYLDDERESPLKITLAQAISRSQHMDYTLQKAVELGVSRVVPLQSEHGAARLDNEKTGKKSRHWRQVMISACEQSGRNRLPELLAPLSLAEWLRDDSSADRFILTPGSSKRFASFKLADTSLSLLCGAEGGFSEAEVDAALASGYQAVGLGPRILRTETAAATAIAICQSHWGDI